MTFEMTECSVLIVEDDTAQIKVIRALLQHSKDTEFLVQHACTLAAAKKHLEDTTIDVVLLDLNMSDSKGINTFNAVIEQRPDLPIIILSGMSDESVAIKVVQNGAQDYLVKGRDDRITIMRSIKFAIERKKIQDEKAQLQAMIHQESRLEALGVLASGVAHEINTPLQFISANISFLKKAFESTAKVTEKIDAVRVAGKDPQALEASIEDLENVIKSTNYEFAKTQMSDAIKETFDGLARAHSIVNAMNVFARRSSRKLMKYNVNTALNDALIVSRSEWKYVAKVNTNFSEKAPLIMCCPEELCQVFLNLIINAAHSIDDLLKEQTAKGEDKETGTIEITTRESNDSVEIWISDTGKGIPDEIQHRVFEPFFTTKEVGQGSGQGLSIVYGIIVEKHNGQISFESEPNQGTVFKVTLPISQPESETDENELQEEGLPAQDVDNKRMETSS